MTCRLKVVFKFLIPLLICSGSAAFADEKPLDISTQTTVDETGKVTIQLRLKNQGDRPLLHIHPMFHFHHAMSMMPMIHKLNPGETRRMVNIKHPKVLRVGRYPLVAMVRYQLSEEKSRVVTQTHMDSFFLREKLDSVIEGRIKVENGNEESHLQIFLKNPSQSFKNIRLMLLLPPGLRAERFDKGMIGFTIRGGEEKWFDIPVSKDSEIEDGDFPVHLMIEYGQMQKHYSGEVAGNIHFGNPWSETPILSHIIGFSLLALLLILAFRLKIKMPLLAR